jgi:hypothetical protein
MLRYLKFPHSFIFALPATCSLNDIPAIGPFLSVRKTTRGSVAGGCFIYFNLTCKIQE